MGGKKRLPSQRFSFLFYFFSLVFLSICPFAALTSAYDSVRFPRPVNVFEPGRWLGGGERAKWVAAAGRRVVVMVWHRISSKTTTVHNFPPVRARVCVMCIQCTYTRISAGGSARQINIIVNRTRSAPSTVTRWGDGRTGGVACNPSRISRTRALRDARARRRRSRRRDRSRPRDARTPLLHPQPSIHARHCVSRGRRVKVRPRRVEICGASGIFFF